MTGLSSVCSIPRSLGAVDIQQMNYAVGVYKVYLFGGGGGGGGYDSFYGWYGDAGDGNISSGEVVFLTPPISVINGEGGATDSNDGQYGGEDGSASRLFSGRGILVSGVGEGGASAFSVRSPSVQLPSVVSGKEVGRFIYSISYTQQQPPYQTILTGNGGSSISAGKDGGLVKAYRVG